MIRDIVNPTIDNLIKSIIRLPYEILQVITKGFPVYYIRKDVGYSVDISDNEIECVQDQPLFEYVDGERRFRQYGITQYCLNPRDPREWHQNGSVTTLSGETVGGYVEYLVYGSLSYHRAWASDTDDVGALPKASTFFRFLYNAGTSGRILVNASISGIGSTEYRADIGGAPWSGQAEDAGQMTVYHDVDTGFGYRELCGRIDWVDSDARRTIGIGPNASGGDIKVYAADIFFDVDGVWPRVSSSGTPKTVNPGTLSVLTEDIDTRAFKFDGSSFVNADLLISELIESIEFKCRLSSAGGKCLTMCPGDTDSAVVAVDSGGGFVLNFTHNGTDYVSTTELSFNTDYRIKIDISGNLYVDDVIQALAAGSNYVYSSTDILFGHNGLSNYLTGYMWDLRVNNASGILAHYAHPGDRRDDVAPDSSGNGLHGKIVSDDVMGVRAENLGFGYPVNEKAFRPWSFVTDDGVYKRAGIKERLNGEADGVDLLPSPSGWDVDYSTDYVEGAYYFAEDITNAILRKSSLLIIGEEYRTIVHVVVVSGVLRVNIDSGGSLLIEQSGSYSIDDVADNGQFGLSSIGSFHGSVRFEYVRKVSPASGSLTVDKHKVAEIGHNLVTNGTFDSADGWTTSDVVITGGVSEWSGIGSALLSQEIDVTVGSHYIVSLDKTYVSGTLALSTTGFVGKTIALPQTTGTDKIIVKALSEGPFKLTSYIDPNGFVGSVDNVDIRKVQVILATEDGTPLVYIDPFDGYVKMTDGTNICQSPSPVEAGVGYSAEFILAGDTMRIDKDGVTGTPSAFTGHMPDVGDRVFLLDSEVYQTCREIYFVEDGDLI